MGRSSHEQAQKNRQRIVECAARLFREFGVDNVSVAEVMSAADMTIGGFYKHFESKDALVEEVFSLTFEQSSATWRQVSERKYDDPGLRSAAIVDYYLKKKGADQACPMIAFAPHVTSEAADESSRQSYRNGTEALYSQFLDHLAKSGTANGASSDQEAKVLFAAMIGARLLAQAVGDAEWVRSLKSAVKAEAAQGAASLEVAPAPARTVR
ncbi:MAG: TetR/AcrR family transcriptional regulator, transcriptional repressor for nem operon [Alphaproteobacteria bacterium]|jgi:TetR/AcrR family transcriptional regulator, transcriptional repressor for nem operon|nr:TetR/AcrR family transcriptional regulator, transcriptional repressor for nem operon [Alphaproteobacteria bacterium]